MIHLYRTTDHWPIYAPWTGRLLTFDTPAEASAYIERHGLVGKAYFVDPVSEEVFFTQSVPIDKEDQRS
jgi:hypothetical protein